ncbi:MAG: WbqC family protein [Candidatus Sumerlaeales bacterium]|nr:WbqC family protein [Candidatus Sumerlaeales bacterium]
MKRVAILQPNYLPWKGVFDMIYQVDCFVFLDDVQYTTGDWRNRNKVQTQSGLKWVSVPVKSKLGMCINEIELSNESHWQHAHLNSFLCNYAKAPFLKEYRWILRELYEEREWRSLAELDIYATKLLCRVLGCEREFVVSSDLTTHGIKDDRVLDIVKQVGGTYYLSGPAAQDYIVPEKFAAQGVELAYIKYDYPVYRQCFEPFEHGVTVLDLIFNCGPAAPWYIWGARNGDKKPCGCGVANE